MVLPVQVRLRGGGLLEELLPTLDQLVIGALLGAVVTRRGGFRRRRGACLVAVGAVGVVVRVELVLRVCAQDIKVGVNCVFVNRVKRINGVKGIL